MRVLLFRVGSVSIFSYPVMMLLAVAAAWGMLVWRTRRGSIDHVRLAAAVLAAIVAGWIGSRLTVALVRHGLSGLSIQAFQPAARTGMSFTGFMALGLPAFLLCLRRRNRPLLPYFDAVAPSAPLALALAKVGCLLAGCCAGAVCAEGWGLRYPYGSMPYVRDVDEGRLEVPDALVVPRADGTPRVLAHIDFLRAVRGDPPVELVDHAQRHGLTYAELLAAAEQERSLPRWPVPAWYILAASVLWVLAEILYRRTTPRALGSGLRRVTSPWRCMGSARPSTRRARGFLVSTNGEAELAAHAACDVTRRSGTTGSGWPLATVLLGYAGMRFAFDPFLTTPSHTVAGLNLAQLAAAVPFTLGLAVAALAALKKTGDVDG